MKLQTKFYAAACVALATLLLCLVPLNAQQTRGVILGRVIDQSSAVVPGAQVTLLNEKTGISMNEVTSTQGEYTFANVEQGRYRVTVAGKGFKTSTVQNVQVFVAQTVRNDMTLEVGDVATSVEVQATATVVQSETSSVGNVVDGTQVAVMPLNGRSSIGNLMRLAPGVQNGGSNPLIAGNDAQGGANFTFDGISNNDVLGERGTMNSSPSLDFIGEFRVIANGAPAEYGKGGAQVVMVSKTGTNELHGSLLWFNRVRATAAKNFFATSLPKAQFIRNEFGGSLGGPIIKNKTFFFGNFEGLRYITTTTNVSAMPTVALKSGNFSNLSAIKDPWAGGTPFANNQIPSARISPVAKELMKFFSDPNGPGAGAAGLGNNFTYNSPTVESDDRYSIRVDHNFSANDRLSVHYFDVKHGPYILNGGGTDKFGNWGGYGEAIRHGMASYTRILSQVLVNEARFGYQWNPSYRTPQNPDYDPSKVIAGLISPYPGLGGVPGVSITGFKALTEAGSGGDSTSHEFTDAITWTRGRHTVKAGIEWQRVRGSNFQNGPPGRGSFTLNGLYTGNAFADFLLGALAGSGRASKNPDRRPVNQRWGSFIQDDWRVNTRLTLNIGLRYEYAGLFTNQNGDLSNWDPVARRIVMFGGTPDARLMAALPVVDAKSAGFAPGRYMDRDFTNFAPRFGFAYRPLGTSRFVVRGSYGLFYNPASANSWGYSVMLNPPFLVSESFEPQPGPVPSLTWTNPFAGAGTVPTSPSFTGVIKNFKTAYSQQWNLTLEHEILKNTAVRATYLGNLGLHQPTSFPFNDPPYMAAGAIQARRPNQIMGAITMGTTDRTMSTNQLQLGVTRRYSSGLSFGMEYMWTRSLGPSGLPMDYRNVRLDRGNLDNTKRHHAAINYVYGLPFGKGKRYLSSLPGMAEKLIGGWQLAGISYLMTGTPFSVTFTSSTQGWDSSRADVVAGAQLYPTSKTIDQWFNVSSFKVPQPFTYGNSARNMLFGPGGVYWDASVVKSTNLTERLNLQFRAEFFNILNHANFNNPSSNISVPSTVGRISSATDPRNIQFGLRLQF